LETTAWELLPQAARSADRRRCLCWCEPPLAGWAGQDTDWKDTTVPKITPFLWFNDNAEEAMTFYASIFEDSNIHDVKRNGEDGPAFVVSATIAGQPVTAFNGGPSNQLSEAFSFVIDCADQAEVDHYWDAFLADGGTPDACGWLKDRFGLSWQVIPRQLIELLGDPDLEKAGRVTQAMMQMVKIDVAGLQRAYDGEAA
jgi:predicted 3-demethylubiquinone-9 3-methyltransferase (glyoxalase superfamily)